MESVDKNLKPYMRLRAIIDGIMIFILPTLLLPVAHYYDFYFTIFSITYVILIFLYIVFIIWLRPFVYTKVTKIAVYDNRIVVRSGFLIIETVLYPIERVQIISVKKGFISKRFNLAQIELATAGTNNALPSLEKNRAFQLSETIIERVKEVESDV